MPKKKYNGKFGNIHGSKVQGNQSSIKFLFIFYYPIRDDVIALRHRLIIQQLRARRKVF
jgi:hypothetical protein